MGKISEQTFSSKKIYEWPTSTQKDNQLHQVLEKCKWKAQWDTTLCLFKWLNFKRWCWMLVRIWSNWNTHTLLVEISKGHIYFGTLIASFLLNYTFTNQLTQ